MNYLDGIYFESMLGPSLLMYAVGVLFTLVCTSLCLDFLTALVTARFLMFYRSVLKLKLNNDQESFCICVYRLTFFN